MAEYISRETVLKKLQMQLLDLEADQDKGEYSELCENRGARDALDGAIYDIRTIKAADVQPVKRGKWEYVRNVKLSGTIKLCECNQCHNKIFGGLSYCGNCGARMDLKDGDT